MRDPASASPYHLWPDKYIYSDGPGGRTQIMVQLYVYVCVCVCIPEIRESVRASAIIFEVRAL